MSLPAKINYKIYQGSTFKEVFRWESATKAYKRISAISKSAPVVITAENHGLTAGWRCRVTGVNGMRQINSLADSYYQVTEATQDTITINSINALQFGTYTDGGIVEYNIPVPLDNMTARMQIRQSIDSSTIISELTTENYGIVINTANNTIIVTISAEQTAAMNFVNAVFSIELINGSTVIPFISGNINLVKEVTR